MTQTVSIFTSLGGQINSPQIEIVGPEVWGPNPLYIQGPKPKPRSPIAEDDLTLNTSQNA